MLKLEESNWIFLQSKISNSTLPFEVLKLAENRIPPLRDPKFNLHFSCTKIRNPKLTIDDQIYHAKTGKIKLYIPPK